MEENYQNEIYRQNQQNVPAPTMTVGQWIGTLLLLMIPIVNIILLFIWAFGEDDKPCRKNYAKATLIIAVVVIGLELLLFITIGGALISQFSNFQ